MGPFLSLAALVPALVSTAASVPMIIGEQLSAHDKSNAPQPQNFQADNMLGANPTAYNYKDPTASSLAYKFNYLGNPSPKPTAQGYAFGGSNQPMTIDPTLGTFGGFGSNSIANKNLLASQFNSGIPPVSIPNLPGV